VRAPPVNDAAREPPVPVLWRLGMHVRGVMRRTQGGPLRPVWSLAHEVLLRGVAAWLGHARQAGVYVGGTFGSGEPVYGISDIDLIVVAARDRRGPGYARQAVKERWRELCRACPPASWLISSVYVYEEPELRDVASTTCLTYGLEQARSDDGIPPPAFRGKGAPVDEGGLLVRPGLWTGREWRLLAGRDLRAEARQDQHRNRLAAWLELQFWWRFAYAACLEPDGPHIPYVCVKLVAEPARIWLWLAHGEPLFARRAILQRALELLPEEETPLRRALELHDQLHRSPVPPLAELLPCMLRLSSRIARVIETDVADEGETTVSLTGGAGRGSLVDSTSLEGLRHVVAGHPDVTPRPLVDWRARTLPAAGDELFAVLPGSPDDPRLLAAAAASAGPDVYPALRSDGLLVFPMPSTKVARLRAVQFPASDPVSFAVADGRPSATFPDVPGWSAPDCALRAVAEHRAWLEASEGAAGVSRGNDVAPVVAIPLLGQLLSAARASAFLESVERGEPRLALSLTAAAEMLRDADGATGTLVDEVRVAYRDARDGGRPPARSTLAALVELVGSLPFYSTRPRAPA
jgi:hypothetical protein